MNQARFFRADELRRVGTAATMIVVCGTIIILAMMMMLGHYNSLAHCGPKAIVDGAAIALLLGQRGRWRCLALLGVVYGLVLLIQVGLVHLLPVMTIAGVTAAGLGRANGGLGRLPAVALAASLYEMLAGCGGVLKIYFASAGHTEPLLWGMWLAEMPLRAAGASIGVFLAYRWMASRQRDADQSLNVILSTNTDVPKAARSLEISERIPPSLNSAISQANVPAGSPPVRHRPPRHSTGTVAIHVAASIVACIVPMFLQSWQLLASVALIYLVYAFAAGARRQLLAAVAGLCWTWGVFSLASYAWNRDPALVRDLLRSLVLRFAPLTFASTVLVATIRPVDLVRFLRRLRIGPAVIIPLAQVARSIPIVRRLIRKSRLDAPPSLNPARKARHLLSSVMLPLVRAWAGELHRADLAPAITSAPNSDQEISSYESSSSSTESSRSTSSAVL